MQLYQTAAQGLSLFLLVTVIWIFSSDGSAYRSDTYPEPFAKCLGEVIW